MRLQPRARRDEVVGERDGSIVIRVTAPPVEGRANAALTAFVAKRLGVPRSAVTIVMGHGARDKLLRIDAVDPTDVQRALIG